jgi:LPS sulfotransferase NodH
VVIVAGPRTGSTALGEYITSQTTNTIYFNEPNLDSKTMLEFLDFFKTNNNFVLKIMPDMLEHYPSNQLLSTDCYTIKLKRHNKIAQIASLYIAEERNIWRYTLKNQFIELKDRPIEINLNKIRRFIKRINYLDGILDNIDTDNTMYYEDLGPIQLETVITPQPINYSELVNTISKVIEHKLY